MIKIFGLMPSSSSPAGEGFDARWAAIERPPLAAIERAVVSTVVGEGGEEAGVGGMWAFGDGFPFAGIAELWFEDLPSFAAARHRLDAFYAGELGAALAPAGPTWLATAENVVIAGAGHGGDRVKAIFFPHRLPGMTVEDFQHHWRTRHAPLVPATPHLARYVQAHVLPASYEGPVPPFSDGVAELWWETLEQMGEALASDAVLVEQAEDVARFLDPGPQTGAVVRERSV